MRKRSGSGAEAGRKRGGSGAVRSGAEAERCEAVRARERVGERMSVKESEGERRTESEGERKRAAGEERRAKESSGERCAMPQSWEQKDRPGADSKRAYSNLYGKICLPPLSLFLFALFFHVPG